MEIHYPHLTSADRMSIQALLQAKLSGSAIALKLGMSRSTINRELNRKAKPIALARDYQAGLAQVRSQRRRRDAGSGRRKLVLLMLCCAISSPVLAGALRKGESFEQVRANLIERGWKPINVHAGESYVYIGTESVLIAAHVDEAESCAVDRPLCIFNYRRGTRCLRLMTQGETLPNMRVAGWSYRCPAP